MSALGAAPAKRLLLLHTLGVILQLLLQLEQRVLGPPLDAGDVEAGITGPAAPDTICPLHRRDANQTDRGLESIF
jgi:hypothetical protein